MDTDKETIEMEIDSELLDEVRSVAEAEGMTAEELISRIIDEFVIKNLL